jgi:hypothetical protein
MAALCQKRTVLAVSNKVYSSPLGELLLAVECKLCLRPVCTVLTTDPLRAQA